MQGSLSIEQMCRLSDVSRAGFYRSLQERMPVEEDMEVRSAIQADRRRAPATLWLQEDCGRTAAARDDGEPQASSSDYARGQLARSSAKSFRRNYELST